jgi:hypothetical protein
VRRLHLLASLVLTALPFLLVEIPPCVDLPQQLAQMRLLEEALADPGGAYEIQWLTPYALSYAPLWALWKLFPPLVAAKLHLAFLALAVVAALHLVAWRRERPPEAALLAGLLVFSGPLHWGFLSFLLGMALFLVWVTALARPRAAPAQTFVLALLLYLAHALWLGVALAWLAVRAALAREAPWARLAAVAPVVALAAWRAPAFSDPRFPMAPLWLDWPVARLAGLVDLGGQRGPIELALVAAAALWIALGLRGGRDRELLGAGALLVGLYLLLPDRFVNTIQLAQRWLPPALMLLVLGAAPRSALRRVAAGALAVAFVAVTASSFRAHEGELDGLAPALAALPERPRLLGLDFLRGSAVFDPPIGMQHAAYGQALRGGTLGFSFAEHAASLVRLRRRGPPPWTDGLEWYPESLQPGDLAHFDLVLARAGAKRHAVLARILEPVTTEGLWRLYRVRR